MQLSASNIARHETPRLILQSYPSESVRHKGDLAWGRGGRDSLSRVWDVKSGKMTAKFRGGPHAILTLDGKHVISDDGGGGEIGVWSVALGKEVNRHAHCYRRPLPPTETAA